MTIFNLFMPKIGVLKTKKTILKFGDTSTDARPGQGRQLAPLPRSGVRACIPKFKDRFFGLQNTYFGHK